ncbi:MAG: tRNA lysidine(34) synthetase TilS, partial [Steroidobacteraceae bacterium]
MPNKAEQFGPRWLGRQLARLLPGFPGLKLCVAFSGGGDSTALLAALAALGRRPRALRAVHVDHGLHPDSARWSEGAVRVCRALDVPCEVLTAVVSRERGKSLEARAREARYRLFVGTMAPGEVLLTAHHEDDQLETVLLQLLRGAGLAGLAAMPELAPLAHGWLARPLLSRSRAELAAWVRSRGLAWLEDPSNADERFDRNYLRLRVLPLIRPRWPGAAATVARSARHAAEAQRLLDELARADLGRASHGESLSGSALRALPVERRRNALRFWIAARGCPVPPTRRLEEIAGALLAARADAHPFIEWPGARLQRQADLLVLHPAAQLAPAAAAAGAARELSWRWRKAPVRVLPAGLGEIELKDDARGPLDLGALAGTLIIRWRRGGERLAPVRGGPRRALKSLLQESRVPLA